MPTTIEALLLIALVLAPGYLTAKFSGNVIAFAKQSSDLQLILPSIACGILVHAYMLPWTLRNVHYYRQGTLAGHRYSVVLWAVVGLLLVPILIGMLVSGVAESKSFDQRVLKRLGIGYVDRVPDAWEYVSKSKRGSYVRVHLTEERGIIGGVFGNDSFAGSDDGSGDLYLQQVVQLDSDYDFPDELPPPIQAIWLSRDSIAYVEWFAGLKERENRKEPK